jgi:hypothetical protein
MSPSHVAQQAGKAYGYHRARSSCDWWWRYVSLKSAVSASRDLSLIWEEDIQGDKLGEKMIRF